MQRVAAQLELDVVGVDCPTEPLIVRVLVPKPSGLDWHCEVQYSGYRRRSFKICGIDSWQALTLALRVVRAELETLLPRLRYCGEPVEMTALFGDPRAAHHDDPPGDADRPETAD
jgi:hypothetical protein